MDCQNSIITIEGENKVQDRLEGKEQKALYHAACVVPLVQTTFQNVKDKGVFHALTGPVSKYCYPTFGYDRAISSTFTEALCFNEQVDTAIGRASTG